MKRFALIAFLLALTGVSLADVTIPAGTKPILGNEDFQRVGTIYRPKSIYLPDGSGHTMQIKAVTSLASDAYSWIFPGADGSANMCLVTDGSGNLSWTLIANANVSGSAAIAYSKLNLSASVATGDLASGLLVPVPKGGTGLTGGTSGGIPYYSGAAALTSSAQLAQNGVVYGGGAGAAPATATAGTADQVLVTPHAGGAPTMGQVDLSQSAAVKNQLPASKGGTGQDFSGSTGLIKDAAGTFSAATLVDADVNAAAAIAGTKITPSFGSQNESTTGTGSAASYSVTGTGGAGFHDLVEQSSAPSTPSASHLRVYSKTDDKLYTKNSAGTETQVGSGSGGGKNYITGSSSSAGWDVSGAGVTATTDSTAADLPDPSIGSALKVLGVSGSSAYAFYNFTLDPSDYGRKLSLTHDQACGLAGAVSAIANCAAADFKVDVYSCTVAWSGSPATTCSGTPTRLNLSPTDVAAVSALPAATFNYPTTFDAPGSAAPYLQLRYGLNGTNTHAITLASIYAGPSPIAKGAAISGGISYTPTFAGVGTATGINVWYQRVGNFYHIWGSFITGTVSGAVNASMTMPNGESIDSTLFTQNRGYLGMAILEGNATGPYVIGSGIAAIADTGDLTKIYFAATHAATSNNNLVPQLGNAAFASNFTVEVNLWVPSSTIAGAGTVNIVQNDCMYASNSSSTDADDTTSFVYGPAGSTGILGTTAMTAARSKRVDFPAPISVAPVMELWDGTNWFNACGGTGLGGICFAKQNTTNYGFAIATVSATRVDVQFQQYARSTGATFSAAGEAWNSGNYTGYKWRLRACPGGQAIGFGAANTTANGLVSYEDSGTFSAVFTGAFTSASQTVQYTRVGKHVDLMIPTFSASCSGNTLSSSAVVPSGLRPVVAVAVPVGVVNSGSQVTSPLGLLQIGTDGTITIYKDNNGSAFTNGALCGLDPGQSSAYVAVAYRAS